jgi:hypothetical protein
MSFNFILPEVIDLKGYSVEFVGILTATVLIKTTVTLIIK